MQPAQQQTGINKTSEISAYLWYIKTVKHRAPTTLRTYAKILKKFEAELQIKGIGIMDATSIDAVEFLNSKKLAPHTYNLYKATISGLYQFLEVKKGAYNITKEISQQKIDKGFYKKPLPIADIETLYNYLITETEKDGTDRQRLSALRDLVTFTLAATTGMRPISLTRLQKKDIIVRKTNAGEQRAGVNYRGKGKTKKAFIPIDNFCILLLDKFFESRGGVGPDDFVICSLSNNNYNGQISPDAMTARIRIIMRITGIKNHLNDSDIYFYSIRHRVGTYLTKHRGADFARDILGHESAESIRSYNTMAREEDVLENPPGLGAAFGLGGK